MSLNLFDNLINNIKESDFMKNFIKELHGFLNKETTPESSLLEKLEQSTNITSVYKDKLTLLRNDILINYANETKNCGVMYYVYTKTDSYLLSVCQEGKSNEVVKLDALPDGATVDSVLRLENGEYVFDKEATTYVLEQMQEGFDILLKEQELDMQSRRIEGHLYEFVEASGNSAFLIDLTSGDVTAFQEFEFPETLLKEANEGDVYQYINGTYQKSKIIE